MKKSKLILIGLSFVLLVLIRVFENKLFYDPFISYYKNINYFEREAPNYELTTIIISTFVRYFINSIISLFILFIAFRKREIISFSILFYTISFIALISFYTILLVNFSDDIKQVFFYIRRFLIQPIFILILLPAFYYQNSIQNNHK